ncbi:MAG: hypothetical protein LBK22_02445, partial [Tannerella sp.]|nr:hypothetical protein [Tannerella sp.]
MKHFYILTLLSGLCPTNVFDTGAAVVRYVKTGGTAATGSNAANATPWTAVCADLQAVINASASGDEIRVAEGVYKPIYTARGYNASTNTYPTANEDRDNAFVLKDGVKIYGGFPAGANDTDHTSLAGRDLTANKTILSVQNFLNIPSGQ